MNNTKSLTTITAILVAAALAVGSFATTTTAFAYQKKGGGQENNKDGIHSKSIPVAKVLMIHSVAIVLMHK
jgi:hypothetical protein